MESHASSPLTSEKYPAYETMVPIMKILLLIVLLLLANAVLGLYRDWPRLSADNTKEAAGGRTKKVR